MLSRIEVDWNDESQCYQARYYENGEFQFCDVSLGITDLTKAVEWSIVNHEVAYPRIESIHFDYDRSDHGSAVWFYDDALYSPYDPDPITDNGPVPFGWCD